MDNIVEIIIFFFIIYSIVAPLLSKKKQQQQRAQRQSPRNYSGDEEKHSSSPRTSTTDILEDFLGFKIPKTDNEYSHLPEEYPTGDRELKTMDYETDLQTNYRSLEKELKLPNINLEKLSVQNKIESVEPVKEYELLTKNYSKLSELKSKFKDPASVQDYILISEILNKPKSLRR